MSNALAIIGFLAFLFALGYGIFHLICKAVKKEKRFSKKLFWPLLGGFILFLIGGSSAEPDTSAVKAEEKYSTLDTAYQKLTKEHQALETKYESISAAAEKEKSEAEAGNEEKLSKEIKELKKTNKSLKQDNEKLKDSQKKLEKTAETLQSENKTLKRQKEETKTAGNAESAQNTASFSAGIPK